MFLKGGDFSHIFANIHEIGLLPDDKKNTTFLSLLLGRELAEDVS
jgi:hypothetical protein